MGARASIQSPWRARRPVITLPNGHEISYSPPPGPPKVGVRETVTSRSRSNFCRKRDACRERPSLEVRIATRLTPSECPLLALSGRASRAEECPLLALTSRTWPWAHSSRVQSATGSRTSTDCRAFAAQLSLGLFLALSGRANRAVPHEVTGSIAFVMSAIGTKRKSATFA